MPDDLKTTIPVGRIDLGPTEPRYLTQTERRIMDAALRQSVTIVPDPEVERLKADVARLRAALSQIIEQGAPAQYEAIAREALS